MNGTRKSIGNAKILIMATDGYEKSELFYPRAQLSDAGAKVTIASPELGQIKSWDVDDWGEAVSSDVLIDDVDIADYDALVLPGGQINPDKLRVEKSAVALVKKFVESGKLVAAICHAPWLLIEAGVIEGLKATSYKSIRTDVENAGAMWVDKEVVVDGNIITSRNPDDLEAFTAAIINAVIE